MARLTPAFTRLKLSWLWPILGLSSACLSVPEDTPARLASIDAGTMNTIASILKQEIGSQNVTLGPQAMEATTITVLPPPLGPHETRSVAVPEVYDIIRRKGVCTLIRRGTGSVIVLSGVECVQLR